MSSKDTSSVSEEDSPMEDQEDLDLPPSPRSLAAEALEVVLKGGSPWGFTLKGGSELRSPVEISEVEPDGKAAQSGQVKVGDIIISVNDVKCVSLTEAVQLIQSAFRTLTLKVWRGAPKLEANAKLLRTSSFLQRAREIQERNRNQFGMQDDSIVPRDDGTKVKVARRIESFHGIRRANGSLDTQRPVIPRPLSSRSVVVTQKEPTTPDPVPVSQSEPKEQNEQPINTQDSSMDLKLKGWPTVDDLSRKQIKQQNNSEHGASPLVPPASSAINMTESWVNETVKYTHASPMHPEDSREFGHTQNTVSSPSNFHSPSYHKYYNNSDMKFSDHKPEDYNPSGDYYNNRGPYSSNSGANWKDDIAASRSNVDSPRKYERRSLPPSLLKNQLNDYQNVSELKNKTNMTPPIETDEIDGYGKMGGSPNSPTPPAPPKRDISSLKYVQQQKNHEKYPSWPVTQPNMEFDHTTGVHSHVGSHPVKDNGDLNQGGHYKPQLKPVSERPSPSLERKPSDESNKRNQSDPGFNKPNKMIGLSVKRPSPEDIQMSHKQESGSKQKSEFVEDFFSSPPVGYPKPLMDQDGNRLGDKNYNIPSPPERDHPGLDQKSLQDKIACIVSPVSDPNYNSGFKKDYKSPYSRKEDKTVNKLSLPSQNNSYVTKVDSCTSPVHSPTEPKPFSAARDVNKDRPSEHVQTYPAKSKHVIVKQLLCYNTGTQTEGGRLKQSSHVSTEIHQTEPSVQEKSIQARMSIVSVDGEPKSPQEKVPHAFGSMYLPTNEKKENRCRHRISEVSQASSEEDANGASMLRKLSQEYLNGRLHMSNHEKRLSGESGFFTSGTISPNSEHQSHTTSIYSSMSLADSCQSMIIHPSETAVPFGKDFKDHESDMDLHDKSTDLSKPGRKSYPHIESRHGHHASRNSLDHSMLPSRYNVKRTTSEHIAKEKPNTMSSHSSIPIKHFKSGSAIEAARRPNSLFHSESSSSSRYHSSTDIRSSESSHTSSQPLSPAPHHMSHVRKESDSVFEEAESSQAPPTNSLLANESKTSDGRRSTGLGRNLSMKMAYGTIDETSSDPASEKGHGSRPLPKSKSEYMSMSGKVGGLGQISEEGADPWRDNKRGQLLESQEESNYANIDHSQMEQDDKVPHTNLRRASSELIRPTTERMSDEIRPPLPDRSKKTGPTVAKHSKHDQTLHTPTDPQKDVRSLSDSDYFRSYHGSGGQQGRESRHLSDNVNSYSSRVPVSHNQSESMDSKKMDTKSALQNFMQRKINDSESKPQQKPSGEEPVYSRPKLASAESFRGRYGRLNELKRTSSARREEYVSMARPQVHQPTEWSRLRSKSSTSGDTTPTRPLSVGSEASLVDPYAVVPITDIHTVRSEQHQRSQSEAIDMFANNSSTDTSSVISRSRYGRHRDRYSICSGSALTSAALDYVNVGYRRPPPPPKDEEDIPPDLPPRNYNLKQIPQMHSDSALVRPPPRDPTVSDLHGNAPRDPTVSDSHGNAPRDDSPDNYAQQLRNQSRKFSYSGVHGSSSHQHMSVIRSQPVIQKTHSQRTSHSEPQEATRPESFTSSSSASSSQPPYSPVGAGSGSDHGHGNVMLGPSGVPGGSTSNNHYSRRSPPSSISSSNQRLSSSSFSQSRSHLPPNSSPKGSHNKYSSHHSPPPSRVPDIGSPELPPPPTPIKDNVEHHDLDDNLELPLPPPPEDMDFPPPPLPESPKQAEDARCADNSYGSARNQASREIGVYSRSKSITHLVEKNNNKVTTEKPPRKSLQKMGWQSEASLNIPRRSSPEHNGLEESPASRGVSSRHHMSSSFSASVLPSESAPTHHGKFPKETPDRKHSRGEEEMPSVHDRISKFERNPSPSSLFSPRPYNHKSSPDTPKRTYLPNRPKNHSHGSSHGSSHESSHGVENHHNAFRGFPPDKHRVHLVGQYGVNNANKYSNRLRSHDHYEPSPDRVVSPQRSHDHYEPSPDRVVSPQRSHDHYEPSPDRVVSPQRSHDHYEPSSNRVVSPQDTPPQLPKRLDTSRHVHSSHVDLGYLRNSRRGSDGRSESTSSIHSNVPNGTMDSSHSDPPQVQEVAQVSRDTTRQSPIQQVHHSRGSSEESPVKAQEERESSKESLSQIQHGRQPSQEELECDKHVEQFVLEVKGQDPKLSQVLLKDCDRMKFMPLETSPSSGHSPNRSPRTSNVSLKDTPVLTGNNDQDDSSSDNNPRPNIPAANSGYWVSPPKAQLEMKFREESKQPGKKVMMDIDIEDPEKLMKAKEDLVDSILKKIDKLKEEKAAIQKEVKELEALGGQVSKLVNQKCKNQKEKDKFKNYIRERDDVIKLLLKVSGLLLRAENALQSLPEDCSDTQKEMSIQKRDRYQEQHEEANRLKEDIDQRGEQIELILSECLTESELADYKYFIDRKKELILECQDLDDKITLGGEQIQALRQSIPQKR